MIHSAPGKIRHMKQPVNSTQIDHHTVLGNILDDAPDFGIFLQHLEREGLLPLLLCLEHYFSRKDNVAALAIQFDNAALDLFAPERIEILNRTNINLRARKERTDPNINGKTTFNSLDDTAANDGVFVVGFLNLLPDSYFFRFLLGKHNVAVAIFRVFEQNIDNVADFDRQMASGIDELGDRDDPFRFVANVYDDIRIGELQHGTLHHFAFCELPGNVLV